MNGAIAICLGIASAAAPDAENAKEYQEVNMNSATDREQIIEHIHSIFKAYLRQDRDAIRRLHTPGWTGFQGPSAKIERGIDAYMVNAEKSLQSLRGIGYELLDTEVQIYGDIALVYYVARYDYRDMEGNKGSIPLRSVDIYRREKGDWNQAGSHITVIPEGADWGEGDATKAGAATDTQACSPMPSPDGSTKSPAPSSQE